MTTDRDKRQLAGYSVTYNYEKNPSFRKHFPELLDKEYLEEARKNSIQGVKKEPSQTNQATILQPLPTPVSVPVSVPVPNSPQPVASAKPVRPEEKQGGDNSTAWLLLVTVLIIAAILNHIL